MIWKTVKLYLTKPIENYGFWRGTSLSRNAAWYCVCGPLVRDSGPLKVITLKTVVTGISFQSSFSKFLM